MRPAILPLIACLSAFSLTGCGLNELTKPARGDKVSESFDPTEGGTDQKEIDELLSNKKAEAKAWLGNSQHALWKGDRERILKAIDTFYAAGAPKVYAVDITDIGGHEVVAQFAIEMPTDKAARSKVIEAHNEFWKKYIDTDPDAKDLMTKEHGQKYIVLNFDL